MVRFAQIIYNLRFFIVSCILLITVFFGLSIQIESDNSMKAWFSEDDPDYIKYQGFVDTFESSKYLIIALRSEHIFSRDVLNYIKEKTDELEAFNSVGKVYSLANANKITGKQEVIEIHRLLSKLDTNSLHEIKKYALEDQIYKEYLVSLDGKFTAIVVAFNDFASERDEVKTVRKAESIIYKDKPKNVDIFISGDSKLMSVFNKYSQQTQVLGSIVVILIISIITLVLFKSLFITLIILLNVGICVCWSLGFYSIIGYNFNAVTSILIPLILVLSIADCIHIILYHCEVGKDIDKETAYICTVKFITIPCFLTSLTTAVGLLSLTVSPIDAVRHFSIGSAVGVMFAFIITINLVPFLLTLSTAYRTEQIEKYFTAVLKRIFNFFKNKRKFILVVAILVFFASFWGIKKVRMETNRLEWFPKNGNFYRSAKIVEKNLFGIDNMEIVIQGPDGALKRPEILKRIDSLSSEIETLPPVKKVLSLSNYIKKINKALHEDKAEFYRIPDDQFLIAQELLLFTLFDGGSNELDSFVNSDYSQGRISIKTQAMSSEESIIFGKTLDNMAKKYLSGAGIQVNLTGTIHLYNINLKRLSEGQIRSFTFAFITIIPILFLAFRSVKFGMLSIMPNLLPITLILGIMGWSGIALNNTTVMVASIALGIAVDDTVHFISRFRKESKVKNCRLDDALKKTTVSVGHAIIFTSIITIFGFLAFSILDFKPTREFGLLISLAMFFALIGDLVVLPASIVQFKKRFWIKK